MKFKALSRSLKERKTEPGCLSANEDRYVVTLKVVAGSPENDMNPFADNDKAEKYLDCGSSIGCVKLTNQSEYGNGKVKSRNLLAPDAQAPSPTPAP